MLNPLQVQEIRHGIRQFTLRKIIEALAHACTMEAMEAYQRGDSGEQTRWTQDANLLLTVAKALSH